MALLKIARMGHPVLRTPAAPVEDIAAPELQRLITDMIETMDDAGGVGLAAPQVHVPSRLIVFRVPAARDDAEDAEEGAPEGVTVLINPEIEPLGDEQQLGLEGCLSIPGLRGLVPRYRRIRYSGLDAKGSPVSRIAAGFHARVVQHEMDHLDGVLYLDRMEDLADLAFESELHHLLEPADGDEPSNAG